MNEEQFKKLKALFDQTIYPALSEDFRFTTTAQASDAVGYLTARLNGIIDDLVLPEEE